MSPTASGYTDVTARFPRVSGDEPEAAAWPKKYTTFSPRERG